jgi:hypothetical protein
MVISRSQPIDSQLRRTSSRFCCKALFCLSSLVSDDTLPVRATHNSAETFFSTACFRCKRLPDKLSDAILCNPLNYAPMRRYESELRRFPAPTKA